MPGRNGPASLAGANINAPSGKGGYLDRDEHFGEKQFGSVEHRVELLEFR
jgi:hypothetical protein